jgi:geranylgeranylglycerol-phosphate geranylgeranyltransferase
VKSATLTRLYSFLLLSRPVNVIIAAASIVIAIVICGSLDFSLAVVAAVLSCALITAAANAINDYFDIEIDRINKPNRPLPSGMLEPRAALIFSASCFAGGLLLSVLINFIALLIAVCTSILLYYYSARLKRTVLFGNIVVSLATALAFVYGGVAVGHPYHAIVPACFAFMMHLGREIIKDMEDMEGDKTQQAFTFPVKFGLEPSRWSVTIIFNFLILMTVAPFILNYYGLWYFIIVMAGVDTLLIFSIIRIWTAPERRIFRQLSELLKVDMFIGLLAIYAGRW